MGAGARSWGGSKGRGAGAKSSGWSKDRVPGLWARGCYGTLPWGQGDSQRKRLLEGVSNKKGVRHRQAETDYEGQGERKGGGSTEKGRGQGRGPRQRM